uniref:Chromo domain-containing protein n=1 Tax=Triticum urartu TaxID=4572 RepID=A0A8R7U9I0_TRIUA
MTALIHQHLLRARQQMKDSADKRRSDRTFVVDDWVFLKLQPYVQRSVAIRANQKLAFRYFGPYQVIQHIGAVAYKLRLPESGTVHPVFQVSQLRQALPPTEQAQVQLPAAAASSPVPEEILQDRQVQQGGAQVPQVLVWWTDQPSELATWEDRAELQRHFPGAPAWGQAVSHGGGDVTSPDTAAPPTATTTAPVGLERPHR